MLILRPPKKNQSIILISLAGVVIFICFYSQIENFFVFHPQTELDMTPDRMNLRHESITFKATDGTKLHGWFFPLPRESPVMLFCHGNAGNISHRLHNIRELLKQGFQVFIFDYRGYGKSNGRPSREGVFLDGLAAYDCLRNRLGIPPDRIVLFGRSLGAAVATEIAVQRQANKLILESAFTSTKAMARTMPLFALLSPFLPAHYNNLEKIKDIAIPKLIIHGNRDEIIPFTMGEQLFEAAPEPKAFYAIEGAGHNDTWVIGDSKYFQTLKQFTQS
ncbi:MAG: hypothetical protein B6240_00550 [Desulfobacteraceae bacterium 4572_87]|nr:MAG: hypothetical protein B6240_00550 [Desulfobacteraceae bacterium 4572_87]